MKTDETPSQFDGGTPTEEEAKLIALGTDEVADTDGDGDSEAATKLAADTAAAAATDELAASAASAASTAAAPVALPAKPEPPLDFAAERERINTLYDEGDLTAVTLQDERERVLRAELAYEQDVKAWDTAQAQAVQQVQDDWNNTAVAFETENAHFLANPMRHEKMQEAIALVERKAHTAGESLSSKDVLDRALAIAVDYTGYVKPADTGTTERDAVGKALSERNQGRGPTTLADAPQAHVESLRGTETFAGLDSLSTPDLEIAFANMSPAQQERYLADAPGATASGR